jgi:hypothetical protein
VANLVTGVVSTAFHHRYLRETLTQVSKRVCLDSCTVLVMVWYGTIMRVTKMPVHKSQLHKTSQYEHQQHRRPSGNRHFLSQLSNVPFKTPHKKHVNAVSTAIISIQRPSIMVLQPVYGKARHLLWRACSRAACRHTTHCIYTRLYRFIIFFANAATCPLWTSWYPLPVVAEV